MRRNLVRSLVVVVLILVMVGASLLTIRNLSTQQAYSSFATMSDQTVPLVQRAEYLKPTSPSQRLTVSVGLQPRNVKILDDLVIAVHNPKSPLYHHFLTPAQFKDRFAPTSDQIQQVTHFLQSQGLSVGNVASNGLLIDATGTVDQAQQAFKVQINDYKLGARTFFANASTPQIPGSIHSFVTSISGLDNSVRFHSHHTQLASNPHTFAGFGPNDLATAYDFSALHNSNIFGDNQSVALLELDGYQASDIAQYASYYSLGLPISTPTPTPLPTPSPTPIPSTPTPLPTVPATPTVPVTPTPLPTVTPVPTPTVLPSPTALPTTTVVPKATVQLSAAFNPKSSKVPTTATLKTQPATINTTNILVDGSSGSAGPSAIEVELDMEVIAAVAPHAQQLVYEGPNTVQGYNDTINKIVTDNRTSVVSISWGTCESVTGSANLQTLDNIFAQGSVQGISFFAASGDSGAYDCQDTNLAVDYPASDPYVTGVGGTSLSVNSDGSYQSESVWSNPNDNLHGPNGSGSGGGISSVWHMPAWQSGSGVQNSYSNGNREVPDVAANADPNTGYAIYCTVANSGCPSTGWVRIGGTSAAAPLLAGSALLINQYLIGQGKAPIGLANPVIYGLYNAQEAFPAYHSITTGNNLYYPATGNYSMATGIGTPDVLNIARDLTMGNLLVLDTFQRSNQAEWGTASDGHAWRSDASTNPAFSIVNNTGQIAGTGAFNALIGPVVQSAEVVFTASISTFSNSNIGSTLHWVDNNNWYKAYLDGNNLQIQRKLNGTLSVIATVPFAASPNTAYTLRFRMVNSTLYAKAWAANQQEPAAWQITLSDNSLQVGSCGLRMVLLNGAVETVTSIQVTTQQ